MTTTEKLRQTVRVMADGTVKHGVRVKVTAANRRSINERMLASTSRVVHTLRFAPGGIPKGVDLNITTHGHAAVCGWGVGCPPKVDL